MRKSHYIIDDRALRVEIEEIPGEHRLNASVYEERETEDVRLLHLQGVEVHRRGSRVEIAGDGPTLSGLAALNRGADGEVNIAGIRYLVKDADLAQDEGEEEAEGAGPDVTAPMPGRIVKLLVEKGADVAKGTPLMIVESMKMETEVAAGVAGTVAHIPVAEGDNVNPGDLLIRIQPEG